MKRSILICAYVFLSTTAAMAQGTGFNFQGRLNDGINPANGSYDIQFRLYDAIVAGNQIGAGLSRPNTNLANGVFSVTLDFGAAAFNSPNNIFIEMGVRPNGSPNAFTILGPRQQLTAVPFAVRAANAANADIAAIAVNAQHSVDAQFAQNAANAQSANTATTAATATNSLSLGGVPAATYAKLNVINTGDLRTNGALAITGNASQPITSNGLIKAMLVFDFNVGPTSCYNGITNSSTGDCGFVVTTPLGANEGICRINFGFPVAGRFASVTGQYLGTNAGINNSGANYRFFDSTSVEVFTFASGNSADTQRRGFTLILY